MRLQKWIIAEISDVSSLLFFSLFFSSLDLDFLIVLGGTLIKERTNFSFLIKKIMTSL